MKLELTKTLKPFYTAPATPQLIAVPAADFLSIQGKGDPNGEAFAAATQALYTAAYSVKAIYKQQQQDFTVCKLEGLWWVDEKRWKVDGHHSALQVPREEWQWQLLIRMPDFVMMEDVQQAIQTAIVKKQLPLLDGVTFIRYEEGECIQVMHTGPYSTEPATLQLMEDFMATHQLKWNGRHHEIYLSDPRKTAPEKMKTILRQPVKK
ncbi:GyrI-like domain-containing protein [uncultured Chitinophaga sp.]|jgi:Uncharacterized conserved protein|uniref:GyrI-like domain-containing protein n=1 Tax=uncultured Chitinophaga sp. TaxID=339340 RepID=UPI002620C5B1|nr:GyrI-like domain-containing protein [uncultured Chitinophaga sp.]